MESYEKLKAQKDKILERKVNELREILSHLDHIESHVSQVCDKDWLQEELSQLRNKIEKLVSA